MGVKNDLLKNRYTSYQKYREPSPFYDVDLNARITLIYAEVVSLLENPSSTRNKIDKIRE